MEKILLECVTCGRVRTVEAVELLARCPECGDTDNDELTRTLDPDDPFDRP